MREDSSDEYKGKKSKGRRTMNANELRNYHFLDWRKHFFRDSTTPLRAYITIGITTVFENLDAKWCILLHSELNFFMLESRDFSLFPKMEGRGLTPKFFEIFDTK